MNYDVDFQAFVRQMLPPILRSSLLEKVLTAMAVTMTFLWTQMRTWMAGVNRRLHTTANTQYIVKALNYEFGLEYGRIFIEEPDESDPTETIMWFESEGQAPKYLPFTLFYQDEASAKDAFTVMVPSSIVTELPPTTEPSMSNLYKIETILQTYKPAGRTYKIAIYEETEIK